MKKYLAILCFGLLICLGLFINLSPNDIHAFAKVSRFHVTFPKYRFCRVNKNKTHVIHVKRAVYHNSIKDINYYRHKYHKKPVHINHRLNHIANIRAHQLNHSLSHYNRFGELSYTSLLYNHHVHYDYYGENLSDCDFNFDIPGKFMANVFNKWMMYHDQESGNGHRHNILNRHFHKVGIGVSYDRRSNTYYLVEDFLS